MTDPTAGAAPGPGAPLADAPVEDPRRSSGLAPRSNTLGDQRERGLATAGWGRWLWRTLTSMRTAVLLLALLALAAIPGSVLPQRGVSSDPAAVARFVSENPSLAPWLDRLGLFNVYSSPWFAAVYLLLLLSMTGCVLPRCRRLWKSVRAEPAAAPSNLTRLDAHRSWTPATPVEDLLRLAATELRRRGFRVRHTGLEVRAEKGFVRELGNLAFHLSLLVLLLGIAVGRLWGFEGRVAVVEAAGFSNVVSQYDEFAPRVLTDTENLEPFSFTLTDFQASFESSPTKRGEPRRFAADVEYRADPGAPPTRTRIAPNRPLVVNGTKVFLTGHGYAPVVTVRDGRDRVVFSGPVIFLPIDASYASDGVIKVPDAQPEELGFEGFFLPTAEVGARGPYSAFPGLANPRLFLTAWTGDLGLADGAPQSVYELNTSTMRQVRDEGSPFARALDPGTTIDLPDGRGSITFDRVARFANFQIARDPGKEISLVAALLLLVGLTASLTVRRRRVWLRARHGRGGTPAVIELAALPLTRRGLPAGELDEIVHAVDGLPGRNHRHPSADRVPPTHGERSNHDEQ